MRASAAVTRIFNPKQSLFSVLALVAIMLVAACGDSATPTPQAGEPGNPNSLPTKQTNGSGKLKGEFDPDFGQGGGITTDIGSTLDTIYGLAVQSDGKIIAVGEAWPERSQKMTLVRYQADGDLDDTFGAGGVVTSTLIDLPRDRSVARAVALQPDGKILVAGDSSDLVVGHSVFVVARYNQDGTFDESFGDGGKTLTTFNDTFYSSTGDEARAMAVQKDGKIVLAGLTGPYPANFAVARYNADGTLDDSFGEAGKVVTDFNKADDEANAVGIQADGKIVVAGHAVSTEEGGSESQDFAIARYNPDGSLDKSFGHAGKQLTDVAGTTTEDEANALVILPDGKIVLGGTAVVGAQFCSTNACWKYGFGLVQYNPDGSLDKSFGDDGKVTRDFGSSAGNYALIRTSDGHLATAGYASYNEFSLALYNADGTLDKSFAEEGIAIASFSDYGAHSYALAEQPDGKLLVGGTATVDPDDILNGDFAILRYR